ncbi:glycosyltransferase family 2 protein [Eubacterium callanderi]|uniref:glycosyltransferase family 2 protein n=1 Tax=Eubacterium callanderi TaxID=53442 RepID=UPI00399B850A
MGLISIIVPCYNEEESLPIFYDEVKKVSVNLYKKYNVNVEFIFVNDGSKDATLDMLKKLNKEDSSVQFVSFSRNFGKESAIYAGLENSHGDYVAIMDADLQDPPELLEEMYLGIVEENFDCVATRRVTRKGEPPIRSFFARCFYRLINKMSKIEIVDGARDFRLMTRKMVNAILEVKEYNRFSKGIFSWVGFDTKWLEYENRERVAGETKWSFWKLFLYSLDGIVAYTTAPLALASVTGFIFCIIAVIMICVFVIKTLIWGDPVAGYPSMICVILLIGGIQLFCMGILGEYLSKTYLETKKRPIYIVKEKTISGND